MATKLRSLAASLFVKLVLFILFLGFVFTLILGTVQVIFVASVQNNLPVESVFTIDFRNTGDFRGAGSTIAEALYRQEKPEDWTRRRSLPQYYYRAEYPDGHTVTNAPVDSGDFFKSFSHFEVYRSNETGGWERLDGSEMRYTIYPSTNPYHAYASSSADTEAPLAEEEVFPVVTVYYAFDDASMAQYETFWRECRYYYLEQFGILAGMALAATLLALWLLLVCGRTSRDQELHMLGFDRAWTEVTLAVGGGFMLGLIGSMLAILSTDLIDSVQKEPLLTALWVGLGTLCTAGILLTLQSLVRKCKAHRLVRDSLIFKLLHFCCWRPCKALWDMARSCFDERAFKNSPLTLALHRRQVVFLCALGGWLVFMLLVCGLAGEAVFVMLMCGTLLLFAPLVWWHISGNRKTYAEINKGFDDSVAEQMKSERTKTALVTNVSHDLKTPLTSIITYIDLLEKEELSDTARDYVTVLSQKAQRLRAMVSDLFDLAKSSSGNIPLELETLDLKRLLEQTLADMRDGIDASGLALKTSFPPHEVFIYSDGKKLYRVFQNIIGNALKYSLTGTRVYISLDDDGKQAVAVIKNTAAYEMDFTAEEILQRFARGDQARSGEGSGLGLSIAESFTEACGGKFKLEIDGDLFKVTASFPLSARPPVAQQPPESERKEEVSDNTPSSPSLPAQSPEPPAAEAAPEQD